MAWKPQQCVPWRSPARRSVTKGRKKCWSEAEEVRSVRGLRPPLMTLSIRSSAAGSAAPPLPECSRMSWRAPPCPRTHTVWRAAQQHSTVYLRLHSWVTSAVLTAGGENMVTWFSALPANSALLGYSVGSKAFLLNECLHDSVNWAEKWVSFTAHAQ